MLWIVPKPFPDTGAYNLEKKTKKTHVYKYRHEDEPVGLKMITVFRDATKELCLR